MAHLLKEQPQPEVRKGEHGQDFREYGVVYNIDDIPDSGVKFRWFLVCDTHGRTNYLIERLRIFDFDNVIKRNPENLAAILEDFIQNGDSSLTHNSGSTFSFVRIYEDRVECEWLGDSPILIMNSEEILFKYTPHTVLYENEKSRIDSIEPLFYRTTSNRRYKKSMNINVESPEIIRMVDSFYHLVPLDLTASYDSTSMSRFLGHGKAHPLMKETQKETWFYQPTDKFCVVIGSDGVFDMLAEDEYNIIYHTPAEKILDMVQKRWRQRWTQEWTEPDGTEHSVVTNMPGPGDDLALIVWRKD